MLKGAKDSAVKARTQAMNQMKVLTITAPVELRELLCGLEGLKLVARCIRFRPGGVVTPGAAAKYALRSLACRYQQLSEEINRVRTELSRVVSETAPVLTASLGISPDTAATLLVTAGDNLERLRSEAAFAALCGVSPTPASSGKTNRHRLNRGGNRWANAALCRLWL
jgi:transposase